MTDGPFPPIEPLASPDQDSRLRVAVARIEQLRRRRAALAAVSFAAVAAAIVIPVSVAGGSGHTRSVEVVGGPTTTASPATTVPASSSSKVPTTSSLPMASTAPATPCDEPLTIGNDGTVAPIDCSDGRVNAAAVHYYKGGNPGGWDPTMLHLPASANRAEVIAAMCHDIAPDQPWPSGVQTEQQAYQLAAQINGWHYGINVVYDDSACG